MIRLLVVDDQRLFRQGLKALLSGVANVQVTAEAGSGEAAIAACEQQLPDVVLMDMQMPGMDGAAATRALLQRFPSVRVLALTTFDDDETVFAAVRAGAVGYLLKDVDPTELVAAIAAAARGESIVQPKVLAKVLGEFQRLSTVHPAGEGALHGLSERELAVVRELMRGKSNKEIGHALHIAEGTVKNHVTSIFEKLGVTDRTSAALRARELGLGHRP